MKRKLKLLTGAPEFEEYEETVKFPSNIPANVKNNVLDKIRLVKNADIDEDMSEQEILENVDNVGEVMKAVQDELLDFACKHADKDITQDNLTEEAAKTILQQYNDDLDGAKVKKKSAHRLKAMLKR